MSYELSNLLIALTVSLPPTIAAIASLIVSLRNSRKADKIAAKADVIAVHVNLTASEARAEIRALQEQVRSLVEQNSEKRQTAALLAQQVSTETKGEVT
jgi:hypothetical protein